jgi:hypothetical protein
VNVMRLQLLKVKDVSRKEKQRFFEVLRPGDVVETGDAGDSPLQLSTRFCRTTWTSRCHRTPQK